MKKIQYFLFVLSFVYILNNINFLKADIKNNNLILRIEKAEKELENINLKLEESKNKLEKIQNEVIDLENQIKQVKKEKNQTVLSQLEKEQEILCIKVNEEFKKYII